MRKLVFISSPYGADPEGNTLRARAYCRYAVDKGVTPIAPHLFYPQFMSEDTERELAMEMGLQLLSHCDQLWVFGKPSPGMVMEMEYAKKAHIPIRTISLDEEI